MLSQQPWIHMENDIMVEWKQCFLEGRDVEAYRPLCDHLVGHWPVDPTVGLPLEDLMSRAPMRPDYPYVEPSTLPEIRDARPAPVTIPPMSYDRETLRDKWRGAYIGRIGGCLLGKPVEGWMQDAIETVAKETGNYPLSRFTSSDEFSEDLVTKFRINKQYSWINVIGNASPVDDDTNYTTIALLLLERYGKDFTADDVLDHWMSQLPYTATCTAERVAYRNAAAGLVSPETATHANPYREYIGAQIRADFYGYIFPGEPEKAAELAFRDASISHIKNGIYGAMFVAAMIATAAVCDDPLTIIESGLAQIPEKSRLTEDIHHAVAFFTDGLSYDAAIAKVHEQFDEHLSFDWCYTNPNAMIVVLALLYGEKDFGKTICRAVQAGFDTDCNGATVGSIIGILLGKNAIDPYWENSFHGSLRTSLIDSPFVTIDNLVERTEAVFDK